MTRNKETHLMNNRTPMWDNLKLGMMLCVVIGHTIFYFYSYSDFAQGLYLFLYTFSMPVFIFMSGLFSKRKIREKEYEIIIQYLLIYSIMKTLDAIGCKLIGAKIGFHFFWSDGPEWYALAMAVFYFVTMLIKDYNKKYMFLFAFLIGCIGGLDSHLGNHFASMRICTFYPVFLAGFYTNRKAIELQLTKSRKFQLRTIVLKMLALLVLGLDFVVCVIWKNELWPFIDFLKAKVDFMELKINGEALGFTGVPLRFICYVIWGILILSIVTLCAKHSHIWTWLGQRTQSIFIWHKFVLVVSLSFLGGKSVMMTYVPHYFVATSICVAAIVTIITAYLPSFNILKNIRINNNEDR